MKHIVPKAAWILIFLAAGLTGSGHAAPVAPGAGGAGDKPLAEKVRKKAAHGGQVKFLPGSAETTAERSQRLKRECKGRVNAGACSGYTG